MRRQIFVIALIVMIITETIILYKQNIDLYKNNNNILNYLEENNLIIDDKIYMDEIKANRNVLIEEEKKLFGKNNYEDICEKQILQGEVLNKDVEVLENKIIDLELNIVNLEKEYSKLLKENEKNNSYYITNFPFINQYPKYFTGCESVSLTMLLKYHDIDITPDDIIKELPKGAIPYAKNGVTYGGNPEVEFVGNPYSKNSYGVYEKPLAEVANKFKPGIIIATGTDFNTILEIVSTGRPVLVWTSMYLAAPYISTSWIYEQTGEKIEWKANEHAVIVIGYTKDKVIIADPLGGQMKYQSLSVFKERYNYFGKKALYY